MEEVKRDVMLYDTIKELALELRAKYKTVISVSTAGMPTVLLTDEGFDTLFPLGAPTEVKEDQDGARWEVREVEAEGIRWVCWRKL